MKYNVTSYYNDREFTANVSCRSNAKIETLYAKCMDAIARELFKANAFTKAVKWKGEKPNVWINGCVGAVWFEDPFINVQITSENGCTIAC